MLVSGGIVPLWPVQELNMGNGESDLVVGASKPADLHHNAPSRHHERGARLHQMHRGTLYDAYQARNACQRWNRASLARARAQYGESDLVVGASKPAISCQLFSLKYL